MVLENKWYESEQRKEDAFFKDLSSSRSKETIRCYPVQDGESLARYLVQETQIFGEVHPDLMNHIDYTAIGRKLETSENYLFTDNGIFSYR